MQSLIRSKLATPRVVLAGFALLSAALVWLVLGLATRTPWLGVELIGDATRARIARVYDRGPATGRLKPGDEIRGIRGESGERIAVTSATLMEEPDMLPTYAQYNAFFVEQSRLYRLLNEGAVVLETARGAIAIKPVPRPITSLPLVFWFQLVCGLVAALTGLSILVFRPASTAARSYALTGVSFMLITFTAAVYSGREWVVEGTLFRQLSILNHLGAMLFAGAFVGLFWRYPASLGRNTVAYGVLGGYLLVWMLDSWQWLPSIDWGMRIPVILGLCLSGVFAARQWRRSRTQPLERAALKWFLFSTYLGGAIFVAMIFVTVWLGLPPPLSQGYTFGVVTAMYLGVAVGITRYRLFDLERWWFNVWVWLFAGAAFVVADLALVFVLQLAHVQALGLSLALVGWLYFPSRQWLIGKLLPGEQRRMESLFPQLLRIGLSAGHTDNLAQSWRNLIQETFAPLHIAELDQAVTVARIREDGLALDLPDLGGLPGLRARFHHGGRRLFSEDDARLAQGLWELARRAVRDRDAYEHGAQAERQRILRDLHDDLGAKLLGLIHTAGGGAREALARSAMQDMRDVLTALEAEPCSLGEAMGVLRAELEQRAGQLNFELQWNDEALLEDITISARARTNLARILREAVTNAVRHGQVTRVEINFWMRPAALYFSVTDNSGCGVPENWMPGRGMRTMQKRARELGGEVSWSALAGQGCRMQGHLQIN